MASVVDPRSPRTLMPCLVGFALVLFQASPGLPGPAGPGDDRELCVCADVALGIRLLLCAFISLEKIIE